MVGTIRNISSTVWTSTIPAFSGDLSGFRYFLNKFQYQLLQLMWDWGKPYTYQNDSFQWVNVWLFRVKKLNNNMRSGIL